MFNTNPPAIQRTADPSDRQLLRSVIGHSLIALAAFVACVIGINLLIDHLHARPAVPEPFKTKINLCLNHTPCDTAFLGSSRFFHGFDPVTFDAETARLGHPTHSFNLGFDALDFAELRFVVTQLLNDPRQKLKSLFIEPSLRLRLAPGLEHSQRAVVLHDWDDTLFITKFILRGNHDTKRKLFWLSEQTGVSAVRLANVGALTNAYIRPQEPPVDLADLLGPVGNGFIPLEFGMRTGAVVTDDTIEQVIDDQKTAEQNHTARSLNDFEIDQLMQLKSLAAAHGTTLILLAPPTATIEIFAEFTAVHQAVLDHRLDLPMIDLADPATFPDLYDPAGFTDPDHVSAPVARMMSLHAADLSGGLDAVH